MRAGPRSVRLVRRLLAAGVCALLWLVGTPRMAGAELVTFATGRTMSVREHRQDGASVVFVLRSGGEMMVDSALVSAIGPDEVPYPDVPPTDDPGAAPRSALPAAPAVHPVFDPIIRRQIGRAHV